MLSRKAFIVRFALEMKSKDLSATVHFLHTDELKRRNLESLPFERVLLGLLENARQLK